MADRYLVAGATGGNGTQALPWGTLNEARLGSSDGDRWICDGTFVGAALTSGGTTGYATITQEIEIISLNDYSATFAPSVATGCFFMSSTYAKEFILGDIIISGTQVGGLAPNHAVWTQSALSHSIQLNGPRFDAVNFFIINSDATSTLLELNATDITGTIPTAGRSLIVVSSLGATGAINLTRPNITFAAKNHASMMVDITGNQAGARVNITDPVLSSTNSVATGIHGGIRVRNVDAVKIKRPRINIVGAATGGVAYGIQIDCNSGSLTANNGLIEDGSVYIDEGLGVAAIYGHDGAATGDNRCNNGIIKDVTVTGSAAFKAGAGHGLMTGGCVNGHILGGSAVGVGIGSITKESTDCVIEGVRLAQNGTYQMYFKGANRARATDNAIYQTAGGGPVFFAAVSENGANNTGCFFGGNNISLSGSCPKVINTTASQDVTFGPNRFWTATGTTIANPAATILGTDYATLALANAASDVGAEIIADATYAGLTQRGSSMIDGMIS